MRIMMIAVWRDSGKIPDGFLAGAQAVRTGV